MDCQSGDTIAAESCNQADKQGRGTQPPGKSNPEVASEGVAHRNTVVSKAAALDAGNNPGGDQHLDKRLQFVRDHAYRIKERPLFENRSQELPDPARQEYESHVYADENQQPPTGAQAAGIEEN